MSTRKSTLIALAAILSASAAVAAANVTEAQAPGSEGPKAVAEAIHNAKEHGIQSAARQPLAQAPGSAQAQAAAESRHLPKPHGIVNNSADQRMLKDASRL